jgi:hypothetical protein
MIPKGNQRGGGQQLATHLLNAFDNEQVEIADLRGSIAPDLHGAMAEWHAQSSATKCKKYLYSLSVNPDHRQGHASRQQYLDFIARAEKNLGLEGQPRLIVFHVKNGREHCHAVWSRITPDMKAVQLSHDRQKLRTVTQDYARDHSIVLPEAMQRNRGRDRYAGRHRRENLGEKQQQERSGVSKADRQKAITAAWTGSDNPQAFLKALDTAGYYLCRGDQRKYTVVDRAGEVHSLAKQIIGVNTKQLTERIGGAFPLDKLPDVRTAQAHAEKQRQLPNKFRAAQEPSLSQRRQHYATVKARRRAQINARRDEQVFRQHAERAALRQLQQAENQGILQQRLKAQPKRLALFLQRITGIGLIRAHLQKREDIKRTDIHRRQVAVLAAKHDREKQELERQARALRSLEIREARSLATALRREELKTLTLPEREAEKSTDTGLTPDQGQTLADAFRRRAELKDQDRGKGGRDPGRDRDRGRER